MSGIKSVAFFFTVNPSLLSEHAAFNSRLRENMLSQPRVKRARCFI